MISKCKILPKPFCSVYGCENKKLVKNITTDDNINIYKLNDQHAFIKFNKFNLSVGDLIKFGVSHPCVTIDNWNTLYMINNRNNITEALKTFF